MTATVMIGKVCQWRYGGDYVVATENYKCRDVPLHALANARDSGNPRPVLTRGGDDAEFSDASGNHEA